MKLPNINKKQIIRLLDDKKRLDNRDKYEFRDIIIETGVSKKAEGSARVKIGKTEVIVGVKLDTQDPYTDHADEGTMVTSFEFSPIAHERYESGPPKIDSIEIARVVDRGVRESGFIDWKKLCIKEGEKVWSINIDIYCINDDGNVMDASSIGAVAALRFAKFPVYDEKEGQVKYGELSDKPMPLTDNIPFSMTFYKIGGHLVCDPNRDEEDTSEARMTIAISLLKKEKMVNSMQKGGITPITGNELKTMAEVADKVYDDVFPNIDKQVKSLLKK